ncbi:MAG: tandem-95 repeat protein, partial [Betaproteobacteria bacterium]
GATSFQYTVSDGHGGTSTATANVTIAAVNDAPVAVNDSYTGTEGVALVLNPTLVANDSDVDGDALTVTRINGSAIAAGGSVAVTNGTVSMDASGIVSFTPTGNFHGATSFQYTVSDGHGGTATATATITVAPLAVADSARIDFNTAGVVDVLTNDKAVDGNGISVATVAGKPITVGGTAVDIVTGGVHQGTVTLNADGTLTFTPDAGVTGAVSFVYTVTDGTSQSASATVSLTVDTPPVANADTYADARGVTLVLNGAAGSATHALTSNDTDVNATDVLTVTKINGTAIAAGGAVAVANGTVSMDASGIVSFAPASPNFTGATSFTYTVYDGHGGTSTATATINVAAGNFAPVANADTFTTTENTLLVFNGAAGIANHALTTNDTDANGDTLTVTQVNGATLDATHSVAVVVGGVTEGTVSMNSAGVISFNPALNYSGNASFNYTISDGNGGTSSASVSIAIAAGADIPSVSATAVGRWIFNDATGTTTSDAYNSQNGTLTNVNTANGGTVPTWITGHNSTSGSALNFDGKGAVVTLTAAETAPLNATGTLSVWFKTTQTGSTAGWSSPSIIGSEHQGDANDIQWGVINSTGHIGLGLGNDANGVYSAAAVNDGNWHSLVITRQLDTTNGSSVVSVYIDGVLSNSATLAAQAAATSGIPTNKLTGFGMTNSWQNATTDTTAGDVYFKGSLDDARIYNHALTADQSKAIYLVENGYETQAVANDGDAIKLVVTDTHTTALTVSGLETGMVLSDGTHTATSTGNTQAIDVTGWNLSTLQLSNVGTGSATLQLDAVDTANGHTHDQSTWLSVVNGSTLLGGTTGNDTLTASSTGATFISGEAGNDIITGNSGNDRLLGGVGDDTISGGAGNDLIVGGTGNDSLTGGTGNDVFRWELADHGTAGTPNVDTITDFSSVAGNKDVLDLRDLLGGANHDGTQTGNIASFLHFDHAGADTIIHVSTTGGFASGYSAALEDETIVLKNVDLTLSGTQTDQQIINQLLVNGQLHTG